MKVNVARDVSTNEERVSRVQSETLIVDSRAGLSPSQMVERKLRGLLRDTPLPLSQLLTTIKGRQPT
jgi:hypothetical protein